MLLPGSCGPAGVRAIWRRVYFSHLSVQSTRARHDAVEWVQSPRCPRTVLCHTPYSHSSLYSLYWDRERPWKEQGSMLYTVQYADLGIIARARP